MIKDAYPYEEIKKDELFVFQSEGIQGIIHKIIVFDFQGGHTWNLGFGDWNNGAIDDSIVTNNHDAMRVLRTVANVAIEFLKRHPKRILQIEPVDEKRKRLYNSLFQRHFNEIEPVLDVLGFNKSENEIYSPKKYYDKFELKLK